MPRPAADHRLLTELDHMRIELLLRRSEHRPDEVLHELLDDADIVEPREMPDDVVTMYSRVRIEDMGDGSQRTLTLCYPTDADPAVGRVSVLSPIGTALLGSRRGDEIEWMTPTGSVQRLRIVELLFQPEASGDYTL